MTLEQLGAWLDRYGRAWEARDADAFAACFSHDAVYCWGPFSEPLRGRRAIRARAGAAVSRQQDVRFGHEPLAVTPDRRGIARWWVDYRVPEESTEVTDEGIFLVTIGPHGLCTEFREWWNERVVPAEAAATPAGEESHPSG